MDGNTGTPGSTVRGDVIALASFSFSAGLFLMIAMMYFIRGDLLAWIFAGSAVVMIGTAFVVGRRALRNIPG